MGTPSLVDDDESTAAIENTGYESAYSFLCFALLIDVAYRGIVHQEAAWDLIALVILGGAFFTARQVHHKTLARHWAMNGMLVVGLSVAVAVLTGARLEWFRG